MRARRDIPSWKVKLNLPKCQDAIEDMRDRSGSVTIHFYRGRYQRSVVTYARDDDGPEEEARKAG